MNNHIDLMIKTEQLTKQFRPILAVDELNLEIKPGEIYGLVGPDGAGKTTTVRLLCALIAPTGGGIALPHNLPPCRTRHQPGATPSASPISPGRLPAAEVRSADPPHPARGGEYRHVPQAPRRCPRPGP